MSETPWYTKLFRKILWALWKKNKTQIMTVVDHLIETKANDLKKIISGELRERIANEVVRKLVEEWLLEVDMDFTKMVEQTIDDALAVEEVLNQ